MDQYEQLIYEECLEWEKKIQGEWFLSRWSRSLQKKMDSLIPAIVHEKLAKAVEMLVKSIANGVALIPAQPLRELPNITFALRDKKAQEKVKLYKKIAMAEGAGTGAGGILLSVVDFPALIGIKFKLLQELATIYGYDIKDFEERMYMVKIFQLSFAGDAARKRIYEELKEWPNRKLQISHDTYQNVMAWREFYAEYRESTEFRKMLQFIPGLGAIVGAWANQSIVEDMAATAVHVYRMRYLQQKGIF